MKLFKFNDKEKIVKVVIVFFVFVGILFYSYIFKLGYLKKATYLMFFLILTFIAIGIFRIRKLNEKKILWIIFFLAFLYALLDKYYKIHIKLSGYLASFVSFDPVVFVNIMYVAAFLIVLSFFYKFFNDEFKSNPDWIYLFIFAILLKVISIFTDFEFHDITEDYIELFSLYFFASSFFIAQANKGEKR